MNIKYLSREEMIHEILNLKTISILIAMFFVIAIVLIILFMSLKVFKEHAIIKSLLVSVMMSCATCALLASVVYSHSISKKYSVIQKESKAQIVNIEDARLTEKRVKMIKDAGYQLNVWTVNKKTRANQLKNWGVDGIFTDKADQMMQLQDEKSK